MLIILFLVASGAGCSRNETAPKYQVQSGDQVVPVLADDLGISTELFTRAGAHSLLAEVSQGQLPSGICVVRIEARLGADGHRTLAVLPLPSQHAIYWNQLFDELPAIREVVFLGKPGLDPRGCTRGDILRVALARDCGLCLIYAREEESDADAEYVGVIWNTRTQAAVATIRTPVILPPEVVDRLKEDATCDRAITEADFRSEQEFRRFVRDVVWDIARNDVADAAREISPWKDYVPAYPPLFDRYRVPGLERPEPYNSPGLKPKDQTRRTSDEVDSNAPAGGEPAVARNDEDGD
ncbi:MAG: hypothetical protein KF841_03600 [Phycisphaerae bacterium]|nr:hypothetical protein [Phycisphaerae bacterium]